MGNSPRASRLNFLGWQIKVGEAISLGVVRREEGSHLCAASPEPLISLPVDEDLRVEWLGDAIVGYDASGTTRLCAAAIDDALLLNARSPWPWGDQRDGDTLVTSAGDGWRLSWERTPETGSLTVRVEPASRDGRARWPGGHADIADAVARSRDWAQKTPSLAGYPEFQELWNHTWTLHRIATFPPVARFPYPWETPGRGYLFHYFGHWDAVHNVLDMLWHDVNHCECIVRNLLRLQDPEDGRFGVTFDPRKNGIHHALASNHEAATSPPLWNYAAIEVFRRTGDTGFLTECYKAFRRNVIWFEAKRQFPLNGLFWHNSLGETGYDNMPRGGHADVTHMPAFSNYAAVDLSSQMVRYYRDMAEMAGALGERGEAADYRHKAETLAKTIRTTLWDEETGFFFDMDMRTGKLARVKTIAGFWPMISGVADEAQAARLVEHLTDRAEFWTRYPVPSVSRDEPSFCLDCWRGPVWASQNLWIILGLQDYGYYDVAASIAARTMRMVASGLSLNGYVYEFYNPDEAGVGSLSRKGNALGPCNYYIGHNPIHAIFFAGICGMRTREKGLEICPQWRYMPDGSGVEFAFGRGKLALSTSSAGEGAWRLLLNDRELFHGSEEIPAVLSYDAVRQLAGSLEAARTSVDEARVVASDTRAGLQERMES